MPIAFWEADPLNNFFCPKFKLFNRLIRCIYFSQVEELENEKRQLIAKLKAQEKRVDHLERAKRKEEIPLLMEAIKQVGQRPMQLGVI